MFRLRRNRHKPLAIRKGMVINMRESYKTLAAAGVLLLGGVFIVIGIIRGEADDVLRKAINICLECIGIG